MSQLHAGPDFGESDGAAATELAACCSAKGWDLGGWAGACREQGRGAPKSKNKNLRGGGNSPKFRVSLKAR